MYRKTDALLAQEQPELEEVAQEFLAKGIPELETDVQKGLQMMKNAQEGTPLWKNTNRAVFNDLVHLVEMAKRRNDLGLAQRSMELLGENSLYKTYPADNPYTKILATLEGTQKQEPHGLEGDQNEEPHGLETTQKQELSEKKDRPGFFGYIGKKIGSVVRWLRSRF
ncbi:hypothetical protein HYR82_02135 [Candidatus Peregrinibacteria bacterium]|nr:hypothetical protein [Candidatus Peregrinibacteria bacterium]